MSYLLLILRIAERRISPFFTMGKQLGMPSLAGADFSVMKEALHPEYINPGSRFVFACKTV